MFQNTFSVYVSNMVFIDLITQSIKMKRKKKVMVGRGKAIPYTRRLSPSHTCKSAVVPAEESKQKDHKTFSPTTHQAIYLLNRP